MNLDHLIPVYVLTVNGTLQDGTTQLYDVYIPVNQGDMKPWADIQTPTATVFTPGAQVTLEAADASMTLAQLGVDPTLTFALGTGDPDSYVYEWYANEIDPANSLGVGRTLPVVIPADKIIQDDPAKPGTVKIILQVTDTLKSGDPKGFDRRGDSYLHPGIPADYKQVVPHRTELRCSGSASHKALSLQRILEASQAMVVHRPTLVLIPLLIVVGARCCAVDGRGLLRSGRAPSRST